VRVTKLVGVSDDATLVGDLVDQLGSALGEAATASRSAPYYVDITSRQADKGTVVAFLAAQLDIEPAEICAIGDMDNDTAAFAVAGTSITMGQADDAVKERSTWITTAVEDDGWAMAMERDELPRAPGV
jgi:hydroxymethylpyrimidine pyrophosphatase-like HAD family hydrolase